MTGEMEALARRAVACRGWRWMPGMQALGGVRVFAVMGDTFDGMDTDSEYLDAPTANLLPDLTDPATLGCLLALVGEAYGDPSLYVRLSDTTRQSDGVRAWEVLGWLDPSRSPDGRGGSWRGWGYASEAEALVAALEAAP